MGKQHTMKLIMKFLAMLIAAFIIGAGSLALALYTMRDSTVVTSGPWQTDLTVGSAESGIYMKARIAVMALFALNKSEAIYYFAEKDSSGDQLNSKCDYRIEGKDVPARWWSITLLGWDYYLIPNEDNRYSYNWSNIRRNPDKSYVVSLSSKRRSGNWISTGARDQGKLHLTLRLYKPSAAVLEHPENVELPRIIKEGCQ
jgi:hypothetical protein